MISQKTVQLASMNQAPYQVTHIDRKAIFVFFFFKLKTAYEIKECDWSSDVCSSDLSLATGIRGARVVIIPGAGHSSSLEDPEAVIAAMRALLQQPTRSEERRVGKE